MRSSFALALTVLWIAWLSSAQAKPATTTYVKPSDDLKFVFESNSAAIGLTESAQARARASGEVVRDGLLFEFTKDCSSKNLRCISLGDNRIVFAVDELAFAKQQKYEVLGVRFTPTCHGVSRPPQCEVGAVTFEGEKLRGFFLFSTLDGVLAVGLDAYPPSQFEEIFVLRTGRGLLHQK